MLLWNHAFQILPPALKQKIIGLSVNDPKALLLQTVKELLSKRYKRRCGPGRIALLPAGGNSGSLRHTGNSPVLSARPQPSDQIGIRRQKIAAPYPRQRVHFRKGFQDHQPAAASQILFHGSGQLILRKIQEAFIHHKNNSLPFRLFHDLQQQLCGNEPAGWIIGIAQKRHILKGEGELDTRQAAITFLTDLRHGKLGRFTLEKPEDETEENKDL